MCLWLHTQYDQEIIHFLQKTWVKNEWFSPVFLTFTVMKGLQMGNLPSAAGRRPSEEPPGRTDDPQTLCRENRWALDRWGSRCSPSPPHDQSMLALQEAVGGRQGYRETVSVSWIRCLVGRLGFALLLPPGCSAAFLFVDVDDVFHQQVPLEAIDPMAIQHHLVPAGWAAETTAVHQHGGPRLEQRWLHKRHREKAVMEQLKATQSLLKWTKWRTALSLEAVTQLEDSPWHR